MQIHPPSPLTEGVEPLLTTGAAAVLLGLSPRTLEKLRVTGGGPVFVVLGRCRGAVRYRPADIAQHVKERLRETTDGTRAAGGCGGV